MTYETWDLQRWHRERGTVAHRPHPAIKPPPLPPRVGAGSGPVTIELPLPPKALHPNSYVSWQAKDRAKRKAREEAGLLAKVHRPATPFPAATIHATFYLKRANDSDNLNSWLKTYIDALQGTVIENDRDVMLLPPAQVVGKGEQPRVVLRIEEVSDLGAKDRNP